MENPGADTPESVLRRFLRGVDCGDLAALDAAWADDGSMFFPFLNTPRLAVGKAAIAERFSGLIEKFRGRDMVPPYVGFDLSDLRVEMLGEVALCTFSYRAGTVLARRTAVLSRGPAGWKIRHLHGSNAAVANEVIR